MSQEVIKEGEGWRLSVAVDEVMYDDSYIDSWEDQTEGEKAKAKLEVWTRIDQEGVWGLVGEVWCLSCGAWEIVDAVGGFIGQDWKGSGYDEDVLQSAKKEATKRKANRAALVGAVEELERLQQVYVKPMGVEPDEDILRLAKEALQG